MLELERTERKNQVDGDKGRYGRQKNDRKVKGKLIKEVTLPKKIMKSSYESRKSADGK